MIELKYLRQGDQKDVEQVKQAGWEQLARYAQSDQFRDHAQIRKALVIFIGKGEYQLVTD